MQPPAGSAIPSDEPHAEPGEYEELIEALVFPASKSAILQKASDRGGLDSEVVSTLKLLADRAYPDEPDLRVAVRAIYLGRGVAHGRLPL